MKIQELRAIAKKRRIKTAGMRNADIIRAIQRDEGNFPCFGTAWDGYCDQRKCAWREDCFPEPAMNQTPK